MSLSHQWLKSWSPPSIDAWETEILKLKFKFLACSTFVGIIDTLENPIRKKNRYTDEEVQEAIDNAYPGDFIHIDTVEDFVITKPLMIELRYAGSLTCDYEGGIERFRVEKDGETWIQPIVIHKDKQSKLHVKSTRVIYEGKVKNVTLESEGAIEFVHKSEVRNLTYAECVPRISAGPYTSITLSSDQTRNIWSNIDTADPEEVAGLLPLMGNHGIHAVDDVRAHINPTSLRTYYEKEGIVSRLDAAINYAESLLCLANDTDTRRALRIPKAELSSLIDAIINRFPHHPLLTEVVVQIIQKTIENEDINPASWKAHHQFLLKMIEARRDNEELVQQLMMAYIECIVARVQDNTDNDWDWSADLEIFGNLCQKWKSTNPGLYFIAFVSMSTLDVPNDRESYKGKSDKFINCVIENLKWQEEPDMGFINLMISNHLRLASESVREAFFESGLIEKKILVSLKNLSAFDLVFENSSSSSSSGSIDLQEIAVQSEDPRACMALPSQHCILQTRC
eukprot:TRINITY_DN6921_c0_g1_i3.p1 TRINITY_DN6921_c0_g1~~TRINITY_DN6921_c0_g1_i3.p1  ORF type:complete len:510 (+),score=74.68 TRINITY_DN6921_c0_g1_i3:298-1827(+)